MDQHLEAVALAVAQADPYRIPSAVRQAYSAGATVKQVLAAIDAGRGHAGVPRSVVREAWDAAEAWAWLGVRNALRQAATARTEPLRCPSHFATTVPAVAVGA